MANFVALIDPNPERRRVYLDAAAARLPLVPGLTTGTLRHDDLAVAWAVEPRAPVSLLGEGPVRGIVWGEPIPGPGPARLGAGELWALWETGDAPLDSSCDGFFAALFYTARRGLVAGVDPFGLFPLYYTSCGDAFLVASSPECFQWHPAFDPRIDPEGLAGILLINGLVADRPLLSNVSRLPLGCRLSWTPDRGARTIRSYTFPTDPPALLDQPLAALVDRVDATLAAALERHAPAGPRYTLKLSGGRDSRTLAGLLAERGDSPLAVTLGRRREIEARCARRVAASLGFEQHFFDPADDRELPDFERSVRWDHLASGASCTWHWSSVPVLRDATAHTISGLIGGPMTGGLVENWGFDSAAGRFTFENSFARHNRWGIPPAIVRRLLAPQGWQGAVDAVVDRLERDFDAIPGRDAARCWAFYLAHCERFHIGGIPWIESFGAWPVLPFADRRLLSVLITMPLAALGRRRLHDELLARRFPALAALPLDRNSFDDLPITPRFRHLLASHLTGRLRALLGRSKPRPRRQRKRLAVHRLFSFESPQWRTVRHQLEPLRRSLDGLLDPAAVDVVLPPPAASWPATDPVSASGGAKLLLGFLLWARDHL